MDGTRKLINSIAPALMAELRLFLKGDLMARKQPHVLNAVSPSRTGNFNLIKGIGPSLTDRLHHAGIHTFSQLASYSPIRLAEKISGLSSKRIVSQDWIGQARKLARTNKQSKSHQKVATISTMHHHYENFTIEFLLDEKNEMRRTHIIHVQSGDATTWIGWKTDQIINFFAQHTGAHVPVIKVPPPAINVQSKRIVRKGTRKTNAKTGAISEHKLPLHKNTGTLPVSQTSAPPDFEGVLRLQDLKVIMADSDIPKISLHKGQPFLVRLSLDLSNVTSPSDAILTYKVIVNYKQIGGPHESISEANGTFIFSEGLTLELVGASLPIGIYRLGAYARLTFPSVSSPSLTTFLESNLLQIY